MDQILTMREKRAKLWDATKAFLDAVLRCDRVFRLQISRQFALDAALSPHHAAP